MIKNCVTLQNFCYTELVFERFVEWCIYLEFSVIILIVFAKILLSCMVCFVAGVVLYSEDAVTRLCVWYLLVPSLDD